MIDSIRKMLRRFRRVISYGIVGVTNTLVDYGVFVLCYELLGVPISLSQGIGYLSGSVCGYLLNSNVTFREGKGRTRLQWLQYFGVDIALSLGSGAVMHWVEQRGLPVYLIKIAMTVIVAFAHYIIYKYIVFRIRKEDSTND